MICTLLLSLAVQPLASLPAPAPSPRLPISLVQDDEEEKKPDRRPEVKEILERLKDHATARRGKEDTEAVAVVDELLAEFPKSGLKDRAAIAKGLSDCFKQKRPEKDGVLPNKLFIACAVAMGNMGPESAKPLQGWIGHKSHRKDLTLQRQLILALGKTKDAKSVKTLTDLITDKWPTIQGAAAEALGNFVHLKSKDRKGIFEEILKTFTAVRNSVDSDPLDTIARQRFDAIAAPMITTLQVLSGHDERKPSEWRRWWNKNKRRDWDKED
jgi:HEAT repeat protein